MLSAHLPRASCWLLLFLALSPRANMPINCPDCPARSEAARPNLTAVMKISPIAISRHNVMFEFHHYHLPYPPPLPTTSLLLLPPHLCPHPHCLHAHHLCPHAEKGNILTPNRKERYNPTELKPAPPPVPLPFLPRLLQSNFSAKLAPKVFKP